MTRKNRSGPFAKQLAGCVAKGFALPLRDLQTIKLWYGKSRLEKSLDVTLFHLQLAACLAFFTPWLPFLSAKLLHLPIGYALILVLVRLVRRSVDRKRLISTLFGLPFLAMGLFIVYTALQALKYRLEAGLLADPQIYMKPLTQLLLLLLFAYIVSSRKLSYSALIKPFLRVGGFVMALIFLVVCCWNYVGYFFLPKALGVFFSFDHFNSAMETSTIILPLILLVATPVERKFVFSLILLFWLVSFLVVGLAGDGQVVIGHPKEMSQLGLPLAMLVYWLSSRWQALIRNLVFLSIGVVIATAPWLYILIGRFIHQGGNDGLLYNIADRVAIWSASASNALQTPWFGRGLESLKIYKNLYVESINYGGYTTYIHPHNFFLQLWNDLGGVGALFLLVPLFYSWRFVARLKPQNQPAILSSLTMAFVGLAVTHSMWSTWWLAFLVVLFALINLLGEERSDHGQGDENKIGQQGRPVAWLMDEHGMKSQSKGGDAI